MKKVLILANHFITLRAFRTELIERLLSEGYEVTLSLPEGEENQFFEELGCAVVTAPIHRRGVNPLEDLRLLLTYYRQVRAIRPQVVLSYTIKPNVYGGMVCGLRGIPYLPNVTGLGTSVKNAGILQKITLLLYKLGLRRASCVFFQNTDNQKFLEEHGITGKRSRLLPGSGVNLEKNPLRDYPKDNQNITFLTVGRIMRDKGIDELLACAKEIHGRHSNVVFMLAGMYDEPSYAEKIQQGVTEGYLEYLGQRSDIPELMAQCHCILHPSYHEGLSNVLLEGAACGRPVIASAIPGCQETFDEGLSGFGVPPRDGDALVATVEKILSLVPEEREAMGLHGRKKVEKTFNRQQVIEAYLEEIQRITGE